MPVLNDVHSRLNPTDVARIVRPADTGEVAAVVRAAAEHAQRISIGGCRHAMGGQQFGEGTVHIDTTALTSVSRFDDQRGLITLGAGSTWPAIIDHTHAVQRRLHPEREPRWGIRQKPTGADDITLGGCVSANIHGRGLVMQPFAADVEALTVVSADGDIITCSRDRNAELFSLVIGGYGLFGVVTEVTMRLGPRLKVRRLVDVIDLDDAVNAAQRRIARGCLYGDFQYAIDPRDEAFLRRGVLACYAPAEDSAPLSEESSDLRREDWLNLLALAHSDKSRAFLLYSQHYIASHGRVYWSDQMQLSTYLPGYSEFIAELGARNAANAARTPESLVIGEYDVPPPHIMDFMDQARRILHRTGVEDIYGTLRLIRRDDTSFMPWASADFVCTIFNLRTPHTPEGRARTIETFARLTDAALDLGGSFYLTYHRAASAEQVLRCYPRFPDFLAAKKRYDPRGAFQSDWYRHYAGAFAELGSASR
ncbi:MAG: hypothetical protein GIKADHBN_00390 [Phycisphaerales bacterium]|nr:hypothetical protein [Phycisphaerales bacterium]MCK6476860.1 FAD-binding oxidoreductase [Phycisphaerales bacterium]